MTELSLSAKFKQPVVIGLGFFDCVHTGHRKLVEAVREAAARYKSVSVLSTFCNNPYRIFNPDARVINLYAERVSIFSELGIEYILPLKFDQAFKKTDKKDFLNSLFGAFSIKAVVCGYDYLFGYKGGGDAAFLKAYCQKKKAEVIVIDPVTIDGERVSSTLIKELIEKGDMESAARYLSQPYFITGTVIQGKGKGKELGFPTANISFKKSKLTPPDGVYRTRTTTLLGKRYDSVTHIGPRPTFDGSGKTVETHLKDFSGDLYGQDIKVEFLFRVREIQKFDSPGALTEQIKRDIKE